MKEMIDLEKLFYLQEKFQKTLGQNIPILRMEVITSENIELIKNQILALYDEVGEALREVPWKPWKKNQQFNIDKFKGELIDIFHFLINLFLFSGMDSIETIRLFEYKNNVNRRRQKDGY